MSAVPRVPPPNGTPGQHAPSSVLASFFQYMPPHIQAASHEEKIVWVKENVPTLKMRMNANGAGGAQQRNGTPTQNQSPRPPPINNNYTNPPVSAALFQQLQRQMANNPLTANATPQQQRDMMQAQIQQIKEAGMMQGGLNGVQGAQPGVQMQGQGSPMMRTPSQNQLLSGESASNSPRIIHSSPQKQFTPNPNIVQHQQQQPMQLPNSAQVMQMQNAILQQQHQNAQAGGGVNGNPANANAILMSLAQNHGQVAALQAQQSPQQGQQGRAQLPMNVNVQGRPPLQGQLPGPPQMRRPAPGQVATPQQQAHAMQAMAAARQAQQGQPGQAIQGQPPQHTVEDIVNNLQSYGDMRTRNELDPSKLQMLNTILSNPGVVQNQFSARANQLAQATAELRGQNPQNRQQQMGSPGLQNGNSSPIQPPNFHTQQQRQILVQAQQQRLQQQRAHALSMLDQQQQNQMGQPQAQGSGAGEQGESGVININLGLPQSGTPTLVESPSPRTAVDSASSQPLPPQLVRPAGPPTAQPSGSIDHALTVIHDMREEQRHEFFRKNPNVQPTYDNNIQRILAERQAKLIAAQAAGVQAPGPGARTVIKSEVNVKEEGDQQPRPVPLPNLQLPPGRQRAAAAAQAPMHTQQQLMAMAANAQAQIQNQQFNGAGHSPASGGGTPLMKSSGVVPIPRAGTPNRIASMQAQNGNRGSPAAGGSPRMQQSEQLIQDANGHIRRASQPMVPGQMGMIGGPGSVSSNYSYAQGQAHGHEMKPQLNGMQANSSPHIPHDFVPITIQSLVINEVPAESATVAPKPSPFPNKTGPRRTLTSGLGPGPILGTPVLGIRPAAFDDLLKGLHTSLGLPNGKVRGATRGTLFDKRDQQEVEMVDEAVPMVGKVEAKSVSPEVEAMLKPVEEAEKDYKVMPSSGRKRKIADLAKMVDRDLVISDMAEEFLLELADEFIESIGETGARLAKHRKGNKLEVKDVQMHLERDLNLHVPGWAYDSIRIDRAPFIRKGGGAVAAANRAARLLAVQQARNGIVTAKPGTASAK